MQVFIEISFDSKKNGLDESTNPYYYFSLFVFLFTHYIFNYED